MDEMKPQKTAGVHACTESGCSCAHDHHGHHEYHEHSEHHHEHHEHGCSCGHSHDGCGCGHDHGAEHSRKELVILAAGAVLLILGEILSGPFAKAILLTAFLFVAFDVLVEATKNIRRGEVFGESFLMTIAGIGAVCIGEIPEGVLVFLLYRLGEYLQDKAVASSRKSISALLDVRPDRANLIQNGQITEVDARTVEVGATILVRPGEKIPLDGVVRKGASQLDTSALTGESLPRDVSSGQSVMAGCINLSGALELEVEKAFGESTASKILEMVENASEKKAPSEKFITRFARIYTPIVVAAAALLALVPPLAGMLTWEKAIYSALCFLAISCPCSLVISVPLSFFAGIGRASREGILVKGGNYLDTLARAEIVAFDKTGTLTAGHFSVSRCVTAPGVSQEALLELAALAEARSTHPLAQSILAAADQNSRKIASAVLEDYREQPGHGVSVTADGRRILAGKADFLSENGVQVPPLDTGAATAVHVAADGLYQGAVLLRDDPKADAKKAVQDLKKLGIRKTAMLSGDSLQAAEEIGKELGLDTAIGQLLPGDKLHELEHLRNQLTQNGKLVYAGDGINDTPVLAAADIGVAMGGLGADAAIETADVIIMGDEPSKIPAGIRIARRTRRIATENIVFSICFKVAVMLLSVLGMVELWAAVFADVGVCMICVLNTLRVNLK